MNQFTAELGRDCQFILTSITCTAGVITDPTASTFAQSLSSLHHPTTGAIQAFGNLERATISINPMQEEISAADSLSAHYETWKVDWELGLVGIRQVGPNRAIGFPDDTAGAGAVNPLTEIIGMFLNSFAIPSATRHLAKVIIETPDRLWTFYGALGPYRWDYSGPRNSDSLTLRPIDIGGPNPIYDTNDLVE